MKLCGIIVSASAVHSVQSQSRGFMKILATELKMRLNRISIEKKLLANELEQAMRYTPDDEVEITRYQTKLVMLNDEQAFLEFIIRNYKKRHENG